jgi:hypothetical protein
MPIPTSNGLPIRRECHVPWETFFTDGQATVYGEGSLGEQRAMTAREGCGDHGAGTVWRVLRRRMRSSAT